MIPGMIKSMPTKIPHVRSYIRLTDLDIDFEKQIARDETYFNKARERVDAAPKTHIDVLKAHNSVR